MLLNRAFEGLLPIPGLQILEEDHRDRQAIISFTLHGVHHGLAVRLLSDKFGVQARGGCSCAGTYGHTLFNVDREHSKIITDHIDAGDSSLKPGWVRVSLHPTMLESEVDRLVEAIALTARNAKSWGNDYDYDPVKNAWSPRRQAPAVPNVDDWFKI